MFHSFFTVIASHGLLVLANEQFTGSLSTQTRISDLIKAIKWVTSNVAASKYGQIKTSELTVAGQSCGGLGAYSIGYKNARVKCIVLFNSGVLMLNKRPMLAQLGKMLPWHISCAERVMLPAPI
jgi:dienelactone hydrolase